jgi:ATP-dependent helicase HrpB
MLEPLPIDAILPGLLASLRTHAAVVLRAPTGAGKTTRVPPALLDDGLASNGRIVVLEPRRLAARAAARRMAQERGQPVGAEIGYHVRFDRQAGPRTRVIVMTPGILLRMLQDEPFLDSIHVVVFDEFHERALDNDLALGMCRLLQTTVRPDLRLVVMSATLATDQVSAYLGQCPIVTSAGRLHPVAIVYEPRSLQHTWPVAAARAIERLLPCTDGDLLCFLPGMQEIRQTTRELESAAHAQQLLVLPLHGDLPAEEQDRALLRQDRRRVILATNVAETSVTVEGVTAVIDTGLARVLTFDAGVGMDRLELTPIARDSADQRAGRAGRTGPGLCVRLWSEASHQQRPAHSLPEISRVDLAGAVLHLLCVGESDPRSFPWLEPPKPDAIVQALNLLERLGGVRANQITDVGRSLARLPVHPRLGRMLLEGERFGQAPRVALAAALLSERDPFLSTQRQPRRQGVVSDVLERVEAMENFAARGVTACSMGTLNTGAARFLLRARDQLLRSLRQETASSEAGEQGTSVDADEAVLRALLAAFPDRVVRRREADPTRGIMVGGRGVRLAPWCGITTSELFLGIDVDAGASEAIVRQASSLQRDWLPGAALTAKNEAFFDEAGERVQARRRVYYEDLPLEESSASLPDADEVTRLLIEAARVHLPRVLPDEDSPAASFLSRLRWLREWMPELGLPAFDDEKLREMLPWLCARCRSFAEVRRGDWLGLMQGQLTPAQSQCVEREAPERLQVPSGSYVKLHYEGPRPPILAVRMQEVFGWRDTPRLAGGRVRVLLHLLAPNHRPQQVTDDLASFWSNIYPAIRKELRARYPKHAWPEDPLSAPAQRRPERRRT